MTSYFNAYDVTVRDGFRERGALDHLSFGVPPKCDLFGRLCEKRESLRSSTEIKAFPAFV